MAFLVDWKDVKDRVGRLIPALDTLAGTVFVAVAPCQPHTDCDRITDIGNESPVQRGGLTSGRFEKVYTRGQNVW